MPSGDQIVGALRAAAPAGLTVPALSAALARSLGGPVKTHLLRGRVEQLTRAGRAEAAQVGASTVFRVLD